MKISFKTKIAIGSVAFALFSSSIVRADELMDILDGKTKNEEIIATPEISQLKKENGIVALLPKGAQYDTLVKALQEQNAKQALISLSTLPQNDNFLLTENGKLLVSELLLANGLWQKGLEQLSVLAEPEKFPEALVLYFQESLDRAGAIQWSMLSAGFPEKWARFFSRDAEVQYYRGPQHLAALTTPIDKINQLIKLTAEGSPEREYYQHQLALLVLEANDLPKGAKLLRHLVDQNPKTIPEGLLDMTIGRLLYANGFLDAAIKYYNKVPPTSSYYLESLEEKGWSNLRKGSPAGALAQTKNLLRPEFSGLMRPEVYFLDSLASLKVCQYTEVADNINAFKKNYKSYLRKLNTEFTPDQVLARMKKNDKGLLPVFLRDPWLPALIAQEGIDRDQAERANQLGLSAEANSMGQAWRQFYQTSLQNKDEEQKARVARLLEEEKSEISTQAEKMSVVEVELLQQFSKAQNLIAATEKGPPPQSADQSGELKPKKKIWFPESKEFWFDELGHYEVRLSKGCQAKASNATEVR